MAELNTKKAESGTVPGTSKTPNTLERGLSNLMAALPKMPSFQEMQMPSSAMASISNVTNLAKYKDAFVVIQSALTEKLDPSAPKLEETLKDLFKNNETYKLLGLDKVSDSKIKETADKIRTLADTHATKDKLSLITEVASITHNMVSDLPKQDRQIIIKKVAEEGFDYLGLKSENTPAYSKLIATLISNADPKKLDNAIDFAIKACSKYSDQISPTTITGIILGDPNKFSADLGVSVPKIKEAQTAIADAFITSLKEEAQKQGVNINVNSLTSLLNPNINLSIVDSNGKLNLNNLNNVASLVGDNLMFRAQTNEEFKHQHEAVATREQQHQQAIRDGARQQIPRTNLAPILGGIFPGIQRRREALAQQAASQWTPGYNMSGMVQGGTTEEMNSKYKQTKGQAQAQMIQGVYEKIKTKISSSFSEMSKEDQTNLKDVTKILLHRSDQSYSPNLRVDDIQQLEKLGSVAKNIINIDATKEVDPTRISHYSNQHGTKGERYDVFTDTHTNSRYYRLTDPSGSVRCAKSTEAGKYQFVNEQEYSGVFKSLGLYEERLNKINVANSAVATMPKAVPLENSAKIQPKEEISIVNYSTRNNTSNGNKFDVFQDEKTKATYYRLTEPTGKIQYAKSEDGKTYSFIEPKDHQAVILALTSYESKLVKYNPEETEKKLTSSAPTLSKEGILEITDTKELQAKFQIDPKNPNVKMDFNNYKVYSYKEYDGSTSYALIAKNSSVITRSIRDNKVEDYILSDILNKIKGPGSDMAKK